MTRSIVLTNHKGGVGESTSATNIALGLVHMLLIDTDSQAHATLVTTRRNLANPTAFKHLVNPKH